MYQNEIEIIKSRIENKHQGDEKQLEIIFSPNKRLLVEAPAGYGKTHTMVSRIAYLISIGKLPVPKKLLALTFSVNAAYKMLNSSSKCNGIHINNLFKFFVWCEVSKSFTRSII